MTSVSNIRSESKRCWVGVDAITLIIEDERQTVLAYSELQPVWEALRQDGNRIRPFQVHHYKGHGCGPLRIGRSEGGTIVQATGPLSQSIASLLAQYDCRATRWDMQVTHELHRPNPSVASSLYEYWEAEKQAGRHTRANKFVKSDTGSTAYTGSRKGTRTYRVYDKSVELDAPLGSFWRYEVELHRELAHAAWMLWKTVIGEQEHLESQVSHLFALIGVDAGLTAGIEARAMEIAGNVRTVERYLKWFQTSVQPVVRDLRGKVESGIILEALGLQHSLEWPGDEEEI